ncbi:integrase arm-type DNA-binding domain-containing protein [Methylocystis sp. WRRC1]|uniref:tyrosine-type recombinase/integrase n=1 Tax=Methylocystis sp. WRRC1 TaxID=1732014 RepID=UPI001D1499BE|nr:site-specific integrase [Methylocystis sp. WRRC1]MCC3247429.1 integrase arm-type DNA-binding domain-containing protein [Methylocystis sp. WRRC1]
MAKTLTALSIAALKPEASRREIPDGKVVGLFLIVQPSGAMSWAVRYRVGGRPRKFTIGPWPAVDLASARGRALEALAQVAAGVDPCEQKRAARAAAVEKQRAELDVVERVVAEFVERYAKPNTRDWRETERKLLKDVVPAWRGRRLSEISKADIHVLLDSMVDRGAPVGANRTFAQIRKMCNWALQRGLIERNPCDGLAPPSAEQTRARVLDDGELAIIWEAAGRIGFPFGAIVRLLILTGQRRDEVAGMRWAELDSERRLWTIPAERSKNRREHAVPLSDAALCIIEALPRFDSGFLFSAGATPPSGFSKAKPRLDKAVADVPGGENIPHWVLHDIRRSAATGMGRLGVDLVVIERCLNHVSGSFGGIVGVYQRQKYEIETRAALDLWAHHVGALVSGKGEARP